MVNAGCRLPAHVLARIVTQSRQRGLCDGAIYRGLLKSFVTMEGVAWHEILLRDDECDAEVAVARLLNSPLPRIYHTLTAFGDNTGRACLFGGRHVFGRINNSTLLNDVWILHLSLHKKQAIWQEVKTRGVAPRRRCHHDATISRNRFLIIYGGLDDTGSVLFVRACVCMSVCICLCMCVLMYVCMCVHVHAYGCVHAGMLTCVSAWMCARV